MSTDLALRREFNGSLSPQLTPEGNTVPSQDNARAEPSDTPTGWLAQEPPRDAPSAQMPVHSKLHASKQATEAKCSSCGTIIHAGEIQCAFCVREHSVAPSQLRTTLLHWLVFIVGTTIIIGGGYLVAP